MLVEIAIGDAYGAGFEFASDEFVKDNNDLTKYLPHPKDGSALPAGSYTDDTQMSIALADRILAGGPYTTEALAEDFVSAFKRDPRQGYSERFFDLLNSIHSGSELLAKINAKSIRNGAMMRSVPLCLLPDPETVIEVANTQAAITHDTFEGRQSSAAIGLISFLLLNGANLWSIPEYVYNRIGYVLHGKWEGRVACDAYQTTQAVWTCLTSSDTMSTVLRDAVAFGGDTDSVASVALGLASLSQTYWDKDLPQWMYTNLETGWPDGHLYGLGFLQTLDAKLLREHL